MNDRDLTLQLRWLCDLATAMQLDTVPLAPLRDLVDRADRLMLVAPAVSLAAYREERTTT